MTRKIHVANLSHLVERKELEGLFAVHGMVRSAEVIDRLKTADITSIGLVEMGSEEEGEAAIDALNGTPHRGFAMVVGWAETGDDIAPHLPRMFESMNIPDEAEGHEQPVLPRSGFGRTRSP
jgi:RNA recognition motif-containing protein